MNYIKGGSAIDLFEKLNHVQESYPPQKQKNAVINILVIMQK